MINITDQMIHRLGNLNQENSRISYQMSTGKKLERGSDDSKTFSRELYVNDKINVYEGLKTQLSKTQAQNNMSDSSISEIKTTMDSIKSEILKALNAGMDPSDKKAVAVNVNGLKDNIMTLSNEMVDGEYIFAGSDTTVRPFVKDEATGKVFYNGDAQLRTIATAPNTYRERGVTGIDVMMYTSSEASTGSTLEFGAGDTVVDQEGLTWHNYKAVQGQRLTFDASDTLADDGGAAWTLDTATNSISDGVRTIQVEHVRGSQYRTLPLHDNNTSGGNTPVSLEVTGAGASKLRQFDINGNLSGQELNITSVTPAAGDQPEKYTTDTLSTQNQVLKAKRNTFHDLDKVMEALNTNTNDTNGGTVTGLREMLEKTAQAFDATNISHSVLGARNKIFELSIESTEAKITHYSILYQDVAGADLSKVAMEAKSLEMQYTALYSTISKMHDLSLVNFVR